MKRLILTLGLVCLVVAVAFAQAKPDFSGTWTPEQTAAPAGGGGGGGRGMGGGPMTITQTANDLTIERTMGQNTVKMVYKLDGTESTNDMGRGGPQKSVAKWDGAKLVIKTTGEGPNGPTETTATYSLKDATLTVETVRQGGQPRTVNYTKK